MKKKYFFLTTLLVVLVLGVNAQQWAVVPCPSALGVPHMDVANSNLYIATSYGVFATSDGTTWDSTSTGMTVMSGFTFSQNVYNYDNVMYSGAMGKLYQSVDFGANWSVLSGAEASASAYNSAVYASGDTIIAGWTSSTGVKTSVDGGATWSFTALPTVDRDIVNLNGNIYIKTQSGVYKSTDLCSSFTLLEGGLPVFAGSVGALTVSNDVLICAIYLYGVYISSDEGDTWTQISAGEGLPATIGAYSLHVENGVVYLGCAAGQAYMSTNNGSTWTDITGTGLNSTEQIKSFKVYNGKLYAGGGYALYETDLPSSISEGELLDNKFSFYPNPVNDILSISATENLDKSVIRMYSITGELLVDEIVDFGNSHNLDMSNYSNGIYIVEINSKDSKIKKGQKIYIQPKRNKASIGIETHKVKAGETMQQISQIYGIKLNKLCIKNNLKPDDKIKVGEVIYLRKKKM